MHTYFFNLKQLLNGMAYQTDPVFVNVRREYLDKSNSKKNKKKFEQFWDRFDQKDLDLIHVENTKKSRKEGYRTDTNEVNSDSDSDIETEN